MAMLNRLANREFLVLVAIVASAVTMHVRQHVSSDKTTASSRASEGRVCEQPAVDTTRARMLPADCMRAIAPPARERALWV